MRVINIHQITFAQSFYIAAYVAQWCPFYDGGFNLLQSIIVRDLDPHLGSNNLRRRDVPTRRRLPVPPRLG